MTANECGNIVEVVASIVGGDVDLDHCCCLRVTAEPVKDVVHVELAGRGERGTICDKDIVVLDAHSETIRSFLCDGVSCDLKLDGQGQIVEFEDSMHG